MRPSHRVSDGATATGFADVVLRVGVLVARIEPGHQLTGEDVEPGLGVRVEGDARDVSTRATTDALGPVLRAVAQPALGPPLPLSRAAQWVGHQPVGAAALGCDHLRVAVTPTARHARPARGRVPHVEVDEVPVLEVTDGLVERLAVADDERLVVADLPCPDSIVGPRTTGVVTGVRAHLGPGALLLAQGMEVEASGDGRH